MKRIVLILITLSLGFSGCSFSYNDVRNNYINAKEKTKKVAHIAETVDSFIKPKSELDKAIEKASKDTDEHFGF